MFYLQAMSLRFSTYCNNQKTSASCVNLKSPTKLVERIMATDKTRVPNLLASLWTALKITTRTHMAGEMPSPASKIPATGDYRTVFTMGPMGMFINTADISAFYSLVREEVESIGRDKTSGRETK